MQDARDEYEGGTATERRSSTKKPAPYHVIIHNDHYTTMDFVVQVLEVVFRHPPSSAVQVMLQVHHSGRGIAGTYTKDIAETRRAEAENWARAMEFPLRLTVERA